MSPPRSPPKSPTSSRRAGRSEVTAKMQLEAEADRLLMIKQVSKQVCSVSCQGLHLSHSLTQVQRFQPCATLLQCCQHAVHKHRSPLLSGSCSVIAVLLTDSVLTSCVVFHKIQLLSLHVCWQAGTGRRPLSGITLGSRDSPASKPGTAQSQNSNLGTDAMQLVAAEYVLDFGYVIKGTQKVGSP